MDTFHQIKAAGSKGLWVLGPRRVRCGCQGGGCRKGCSTSSTKSTSAKKPQQEPGGILEEAEEEGSLPPMGSYALPTQEIKGL